MTAWQKSPMLPLCRNTHPKSMSCTSCRQPRLMDKLGRCRACLIKSGLFSLLSLVGMAINAVLGADPIMHLVCATGGLMFGSLFLLHLVYGWHYRWRAGE